MTTFLPSVQGEALYKASQPAEPLTVQEADEYVDTHSEEIVECRMNMRHVFPRPRRGQLIFNGVDEDNNFLRTQTCARCGCATRIETWAPVKRGKEWRYEFLDKVTLYHKNEKGETYLLPPGLGRGRPTLFREAFVSGVMQGQSPAAIRKLIAREQAA